MRGLRFLHGAGITAGDVKPANILLNKELSIMKLTDFGLGGGELMTLLWIRFVGADVGNTQVGGDLAVPGGLCISLCFPVLRFALRDDSDFINNLSNLELLGCTSTYHVVLCKWTILCSLVGGRRWIKRSCVFAVITCLCLSCAPSEYIPPACRSTNLRKRALRRN